MWNVTVSRRASKQIHALPDTLKARIFTLLKEIECTGPIRGTWPNYGKLTGNRHHCHIKKGKPTYVAIWKVIDFKSVEVVYAGTHERAPY